MTDVQPTPLAASNPITIGELTDVPVPGSLVASGWANEVSNRIIHRFATVAARDAAWPAAAGNKGAVCETMDSMRIWQSTGLAWQSITDITPVGTVRATIKTVADPNWLILDGSTVASGATLYPDLWAIVPAGWKSGNNLVLPNMVDRTLLGAGTTTLGNPGGANVHTIAAANLPPHAHSIAHDHPNAGVNISDPGHYHAGSGGSKIVNQVLSGGSQAVQIIAGTAQIVNNDYTAAAATGISATVDLPYFGGNSDNGPGNGSAFDTTPAHLAVTWQIKAA